MIGLKRETVALVPHQNSAILKNYIYRQFGIAFI